LTVNRALWAISLGHAVTHWYPVIFYLVLPLIGKELGLSYTQVGLIITARYVVSTIANIQAGMLVDMAGRRIKLLIAALFWVGLPYLFIALCNNYWTILLAAGAIGIGNNLWHPAAIAMLGDLYPERRGWAIGIHSTAANCGDALGPVAAGALLVTITWREMLTVNIIPGIVAAFFIYFIFKDRETNNNTGNSGGSAAEKNRGLNKESLSFSEYSQGFKLLCKNIGFLILIIVSTVRSMVQNSLLIFLPVYLIGTLGFSTVTTGFYLGAMQLAGGLASPLSGYFSDRKGRKTIVLSGLLVSGASILIMVLVKDKLMFAVSIALLGFFLYSLRPVILAWITEITPREMGGTAIGMAFGIQSFGNIFTPLCCGIIADLWGVTTIFYFISALIVIANVPLIFIRDQYKENTKDIST